MFLTNGPAEVPKWIEALAGAVGHCGRPVHQKPAKAGNEPWENEAVCCL